MNFNAMRRTLPRARRRYAHDALLARIILMYVHNIGVCGDNSVAGDGGGTARDNDIICIYTI